MVLHKQEDGHFDSFFITIVKYIIIFKESDSYSRSVTSAYYLHVTTPDHWITFDYLPMNTNRLAVWRLFFVFRVS